MHILYLILSLLRSFCLLILISFTIYHIGTVRSQNAGTLTDTDLLPRQIFVLTWLEALSIYCLIENFCQLIELFEFTESLIFWFALQNKLKFEYILWKILFLTWLESPLCHQVHILFNWEILPINWVVRIYWISYI